MADPLRIALVRVTHFSGVNAALLGALSQRARIVTDIDAYGAIDPRRLSWNAALNLAATFARFGFAGRSGSRHLKTEHAFRAMSAYARRHVAAVGRDLDLLLQTQCLCDASGMTTAPFVVYTDYTYPIAARAYPAWTGSDQVTEMERRTLRAASLVALHNEAARRSVIDDCGVPEERTVVVGCGVGAVPDEAPGARPRRITCISTDPIRQRVDLLRRAFAERLRPEYPSLELVLGGPPFARVTAKPGEKMLGSLSRDEVDALLRETSIYVMPARLGGYSSVLDAMARGCACVVIRDNDLLGPAVADGNTCIVAPRADAGAIAEAVAFLLDHPTEARRLGNAAHAYVAQECTWSTVADKILSAAIARDLVKAQSILPGQTDEEL